MKLLAAAILASITLISCISAQGIRLPSPVKVLPANTSGSPRSEIQMPDENNVNPLVISHNTTFTAIDGSSTGTPLSVYGSALNDGRIYLQAGAVAAKNSVVVQAASNALAGPTLQIRDTRQDQGLNVYLNGVSYLTLDSSSFANVATFTTPDHFEFKGGPLESQDIFPLLPALYDIGSPFGRFRGVYAANETLYTSLTLDFLAGGGARCATISNTGAVGAAACAGGGTVTSVGFTGGIISVANPTTTPAFTVAGTNGGMVYFTTASTWASSGLLDIHVPVLGGGAGGTPHTAASAGSAGQCFISNGAFADPTFQACTSGSGANTALSNLSGVAINTTLLPASSGSANLGSSSKPFGQQWATQTFAEEVRVANPATSLGTSWLLSSAVVSTVQKFYIKDTSSAIQLEISAGGGAANGMYTGFISPRSDATFGLGSPSGEHWAYVAAPTLISNLATSLRIVHQSAQPIEFAINGSNRMVISSTGDVSIAGTNFSIGGSAGITGATCSSFKGGICIAP